MGVDAGSSASSSRFSSSPQNLQNPAYTGLAPFIASGLQTTATDLTNGGIVGLQGNAKSISPWTVNGAPSGAVNNAWDPTGQPSNPLVAGLSLSEGNGLSQGQKLAMGAVPGQGNDLVGSGAGTLQRFMDPNYAADLATSPQTQSAISSAVNPILTAFKQTTMPALQEQFTAAGQNMGGALGRGSSAFDRAANEATSNLMAQTGAVAGNIAQNAYQTGLTQQAQAPSQAAAIGTQEISNILNNLQAQALPRLVKQYGINQGLSLYQSQVQSLLQVLGLGGQVSQPSLGYTSMGGGSSSGKSGGFNLGNFSLPKIG